MCRSGFALISFNEKRPYDYGLFYCLWFTGFSQRLFQYFLLPRMVKMPVLPLIRAPKFAGNFFRAGKSSFF